MLDEEYKFQEVVEERNIEDTIAFLADIFNIQEMVPNVLVGTYTLQEWKEKRPEIFLDLEFLIDECDYHYLTVGKLEEIVYAYFENPLEEDEYSEIEIDI